MNTHTGQFIRPTLQESVSGWVLVQFTKAEAARAIMANRMREQCAKGRGNRALRRRLALSA